MILGTGFYDHEEPPRTTIPGIGNFKGPVVHPQFWPEDLEYANRKVAIIGSGATAITLLPNLAKQAEIVTIVQRSPSYVVALSAKEGCMMKLARVLLPERVADKFARWKWLIKGYSFFYLCRAFPYILKKLIRAAAKKQLPRGSPLDPYFTPTYNPWDQRVCFAPNGDFYRAIREGKSNIVTGKISTITANTIKLESGEEVIADIIITATGSKLQFTGGIKLSTDGFVINPEDKFIWKLHSL